MIPTRFSGCADVSDDGPLDQIRYQWSFSRDSDNGTLGLPTPSFVDNVSNPATMVNYDPMISGVISLVVTDDNGTGASTEITYQMKQGQFPEGLVIDKDIVGEFELLTSVMDDNGTAIEEIDALAGGDVVDNATGELLATGDLFFTTPGGSDLWVLDNGSNASALPASYYDNGSAVLLYNLSSWDLSQGLLVTTDNASESRLIFGGNGRDNASNQELGRELIIADRTGVKLLDIKTNSSSGGWVVTPIVLCRVVIEFSSEPRPTMAIRIPGNMPSTV